MSTARRLLAIASGGGTGLTPPAIVRDILAAPEGGWTWFIDPRAVHYNGLTYFGFVNGDGDIIVRTVDPATGAVGAESNLHTALQVDDHANPSLLVRDSDHKLLVFYCAHDDTTMRVRVSTTSLDTDPDLGDGFAAESSLDASLGGADYTYPNPIQLTAETNAPIYLFYRDVASGTTHDLVYGKSTDGGASWSAQTIVARDTSKTGRCYWRIAQNGTDRIDFAVTDGHPFHDSDVSIYHFYYEGGAYFRSDGSSAGSLPIDTSDMTEVYDGAAGDEAWVWDIAIDDGQPVIAFATFPSTSDHRYQYARWTGSAWDVTEVVASGGHIYGNGDEPYYSGGVVIDRADGSRLYLSREVAGEWEMYMYTRNGSGWTVRAMTEGSPSKQIRPAPVHGADSRLRVLWMAGDYTTYTDWDTGTRGGR